MVFLLLLIHLFFVFFKTKTKKTEKKEKKTKEKKTEKTKIVLFLCFSVLFFSFFVFLFYNSKKSRPPTPLFILTLRLLFILQLNFEFYSEWKNTGPALGKFINLFYIIAYKFEFKVILCSLVKFQVSKSILAVGTEATIHM